MYSNRACRSEPSGIDQIEETELPPSISFMHGLVDRMRARKALFSEAARRLERERQRVVRGRAGKYDPALGRCPPGARLLEPGTGLIEGAALAVKHGQAETDAGHEAPLVGRAKLPKPAPDRNFRQTPSSREPHIRFGTVYFRVRKPEVGKFGDGCGERVPIRQAGRDLERSSNPGEIRLATPP